MNYKGKWALVTGASSGIGETFARKLASRGTNLILVARRNDRLQALSRELVDKYGIYTAVIAQDLSLTGAAIDLWQKIGKLGHPVDILINNAGFGASGHFHDTPLATNQQMLRLNIATLADLTQLALPAMIERKDGMIFNIASTAAFQPLPYFATYSASKAFVLSFTEALAIEYAPLGIRILAVCPGATETEFFATAGMDKAHLAFDSSNTVVLQALEAMEKGRISIVCGSWKNRLLVTMNRFFTRHMTARIAGIVMNKTIK